MGLGLGAGHAPSEADSFPHVASLSLDIGYHALSSTGLAPETQYATTPGLVSYSRATLVAESSTALRRKDQQPSASKETSGSFQRATRIFPKTMARLTMRKRLRRSTQAVSLPSPSPSLSAYSNILFPTVLR